MGYMPMCDGSFALLSDRAAVAITGPDALSFLQGIVTTDIGGVASRGAAFGALLTPQGKIIADFILHPLDEGVLVDLPISVRADFMKRMALYRLRARVTITDLSAERRIAVWWSGTTPPVLPGVIRDPRLAALGWRAALPDGIEPAAPGYAAAREDDWQAHRIALGVPESARDFAFGEVFPHDVDMDDLAGLDFRKGCYVGQEIVARMQHRGTARRRAVQVEGDHSLPPPGTPIEAGGLALGTLGSSAGTRGIALVRLDKVKRALEAGSAVTAMGVPLAITLPAFATFGWPAAGEGEGAA